AELDLQQPNPDDARAVGDVGAIGLERLFDRRLLRHEQRLRVRRGGREDEPGAEDGGEHLPQGSRSTNSFDAARVPIVIARSLLPRSFTASAAASRISTSIRCPGFRSLLSMKRRNAGS